MVQNPIRDVSSLWDAFPGNVHIAALLHRCQEMQVSLGISLVPEQWLYHPKYRTIYVWEPDLQEQSLSFLVLIIAHELGHAYDFDQHPAHAQLIQNMHWSKVPDFVEREAFVNGFHILKELKIPFSMQHYLMMIDQQMADQVRQQLEGEMCCLLSPRSASALTRPAVNSTHNKAKLRLLPQEQRACCGEYHQ